MRGVEYEWSVVARRCACKKYGDAAQNARFGAVQMNDVGPFAPDEAYDRRECREVFGDADVAFKIRDGNRPHMRGIKLCKKGAFAPCRDERFKRSRQIYGEVIYVLLRAAPDRFGDKVKDFFLFVRHTQHRTQKRRRKFSRVFPLDLVWGKPPLDLFFGICYNALVSVFRVYYSCTRKL